MKRRWILPAAAFLLVAGGAAWWLLRPAKVEAGYKTEKAALADIRETVAATGTVNPITTVNVGTQVSGTIKEILADFNDRVRKGQLIARIDPSLFEESRKQAEANLVAAQANLDRARATEEDARRTFERNGDLFTRGLIPRSDLDSAETSFHTAAAATRSAAAQATQAEAALSNAETNLRYTRIASPVDGVVISRAVDVGQTVAASFQTPTLFTIAQDLTRMEIHTSVDEADIGRVREGQEVEFNVDAYPDRMFRGKVHQVRNAPVTVQNVVTYDVVVRVENPDFLLKPGMTANVTIVTAEKKQVLAVSAAALRFKMTEKAPAPGSQGGRGAGAGRGAAGPAAARSSVWVLEGNSPRRVPVETGLTDGSYTEVLSGDLPEGSEVITGSNGGTSGSSASQGAPGTRGGNRPPPLFH